MFAADFKNPPAEYRPETWFHLNGNNISKEGLTRDLEAIKYAGLQGIHLFNKNGQLYPGVEPIKILSPEWEDMIRHAADECKRLGLKFTMQNCPGWSMTGGPWVPVEEAQRELVETVYHFQGGRQVSSFLAMDENYDKPEYNYQDVTLLAFPTPEGDDAKTIRPSKITTNNTQVPWKRMINPEKRVEMVKRSLPEDWRPYSQIGIAPVEGKRPWVNIKFDEEITVRSIVFPPIRYMLPATEYPVIDVTLRVQAKVNNQLKDIAEIKIPDGNWSDRQYDVTLALPVTTSDEFKLTFLGGHVINPGYIFLESKPRLHNHEAKAARALRNLERDVDINFEEECFVGLADVIDISDKMDKSGKLNWDAPEGKWTVVRFGHVNMRRTNKPAVPEATGWECSKLDKIAIENHLRNGMIGDLIKDGGPIGDGKLQGLLIDSWESFIPTWSMNSEDMFREFESRRGYELKPFLPATMGYIVENQKTTTKFLRDLRHTMDELYIENFFQHFATVAHEMGVEVYTEGAGGEVLPIDPMRYYGVADIPMTEFWYPRPPSVQNEYAKPIFSAASATHLYDKPKLAAEACTQIGVKWNEHPYSVKSLIDYNFTKGVNHLVFHTFSHTPQTDVYPGSSFGSRIGFPLVRQQTWWQHMPEWIDYLTRNQYILQQGEYVADVLWYYGDHYERPPFDPDYFPKGYRFDYLNNEILNERLSVGGGKINVKGAGDYRVILLRDSREMLLSTAQKLKGLVLQGAVVVGQKPLGSPSLMDGDEELKKLTLIADELWGKGENGVKEVGKGRVYWGKSIGEVLQAENITQDVVVPGELGINWIHRRTDDADIYFISSRNEKAVDVSLSFRVANAYPLIWDAYTGEKQEAKVWGKQGGRTNVAVSLDPNGSTIVVFPHGNKTPKVSKVEFEGKTILSAESGWFRVHETNGLPKVDFHGDRMYATQSGTYILHGEGGAKKVDKVVKESALNQGWTAKFNAGWDTPESVDIETLKSLVEMEDDAIRHYSGTITYSKMLDYKKDGSQTILDLGDVYNIAELWCNGEKVATRWAPPYTFDVTDKLTNGANKLEIKVTNTWRNQLIYDNQRPKEKKKTWTTNGPKPEETELEPTGLVGPVVLRSTMDSMNQQYENK